VSALSRLEDVDPKQVRHDERSGSITLHARRGRSLEVAAIRSALESTRLFPRRGLRVTYLELTAAGEVTRSGSDLRLRVSGTRQEFVLGPMPGSGPPAVPFRRLRESLGRKEKVVSVTGRVHGWSGGDVPGGSSRNRPPAARPAETKPVRLLVTAFEKAPG
jgi:hypothetical protein